LEDNGKLSISTRMNSISDSIELEFKDTGQGISEENLEKIFDPFFTTKDVGKGTGLGMSVVHGIITSHGGTIHVDSRAGQGTRFEILLPIAE